MAEDPEACRRRQEQQQLRKQLHEVFGPFDQFCEYVAGTTSAGASGIMRHGVVQIPTTPLLMPARSNTIPHTSSANSSTAHQSTQQLLQSMQNLVASPIPPLHGLPFCNRDYLNSTPSSSTYSAPDSGSTSRNPKRHRTLDSDSEVEKEKRKRCSDENKASSCVPSTSRSSTQPPSNSLVIRALPENKNEGKLPPDKGLSPDSGVHSAENDAGDENDVQSAQSIINLITRLSPPLSPIKHRPLDKKLEKEHKEVDTREKERKSRDREEEREFLKKEKELHERQEGEQADEEERIKSERLESERKEREREEKVRRDRERGEKERRDKEHEEKGKNEKDREDKLKRDREYEEKMRKEKEQEDKHRRDKERELRKHKDKERHVSDRATKDTDCKEKISEQVDKTKFAGTVRQGFEEDDQKNDVNGLRVDDLKGEIILKALDRSRLNQLIEIGRKTGRMKEGRKEDRREKSDKYVERRKDRKDKKTKSEGGDAEELDTPRQRAEASLSGSPCMPRASSSQSHDGGEHLQINRPSSVTGSSSSRGGFECAAPEIAPTKPSRPVKPEEGSTQMLYDFYHAVAKSRKRKADVETDKVNKILLYLDTSVYFILSARHLTSPESPEVRGNRQYSIIRDTNDLLKLPAENTSISDYPRTVLTEPSRTTTLDYFLAFWRVTQAFLSHPEGGSPLTMHMLTRVRNLSWRCQSSLLYHMYNLRSQNAIKSYGMLSHLDAQIQEEQQQQQQQQQNGTGTTSPSSSVHSNSNHSTTFVTMPTKVYDIQRTQLKTLHHLMWSHKVWQDATKRAEVCSIDLAFIAGLEKVCGHLFLDAPLEKMCAYVLTGISWLRAEYEREKIRPPPSVPKRIGTA